MAKNFKKVLTYSLMASVMMVVLCSTDSIAKPVLTMFYPTYQTGDIKTEMTPYAIAMREIFEEFETKYDVKLHVESIAWDQIDSKLMMTVRAGNPPDISWFSGQKLAAQVNAGSLMPLDDYVEKYLSEEFIKDLSIVDKESMISVRDGRRYGFLVSVHSRLLWYRKDLIPEAPSTWDDLVKWGQSVAKPEENFWGFIFYGLRHYGTIELVVGPFIWANRARISDEKGRAVWNTPQVAEAIQFLSDCVNKYRITPRDIVTTAFADMWNSFLAGNAAMTIDGTYYLGAAKQSGLWKEGKIGMTFIPSPKGDTSANFSNGWALGVPRGSKQPGLAWKFIEFWQSREVQVKHALVEGGMPTRRSGWLDPAFSDPVYQFFFMNIELAGHPMDPLVYYEEALDELAVVYQDYLLHPEKNLDKMLEEASRSFNKRYYGS